MISVRLGCSAPRSAHADGRAAGDCNRPARAARRACCNFSQPRALSASCFSLAMDAQMQEMMRTMRQEEPKLADRNSVAYRKLLANLRTLPPHTLAQFMVHYVKEDLCNQGTARGRRVCLRSRRRVAQALSRHAAVAALRLLSLSTQPSSHCACAHSAAAQFASAWTPAPARTRRRTWARATAACRAC